MNKTHCTSTFGTLAMLGENQRIGYMVANILIALVNLVTNLCVIIIIIKTKQIKNQSIKLVYYLSISNVLFAVIGQPIFAAILYLGTEVGCTEMRLLLLVIEFFMYSSTYLTGMLGFDRYIRIRYQSTYNKVYSRLRFNLSLVILYILIVLQAGLGTMSRFLNLSAVLINLPVNVIMFLIVACLYGKSILILREYEQTAKRLFKHKKKVPLTRLASLYIATDTILCLPLVIILSAYYFIQKSSIDYELKAIIFYTCFLFFLCHCPINAVCFLFVNKKAKSRLVGKKRKSTDALNNSSSYNNQNDTIISKSQSSPVLDTRM
eukprot:TCONS_00066642-protein